MHYKLWMLTTLILASASPWTYAQATSQFNATTLDFSGFNGKINIESHAGKTILLQLKRGNQQALEAMVNQGVLRVSYQEKNVALNRSGSFSPIEESADLTVKVPADTALQAIGFVGKADIDSMNGPADLSVSTGHIKAKRLGPSRLRVKGAGAIELIEATKDVRTAIDGAGDITIKGGAVENLWADTSGAGSIRYTGGRIRQAFTSARGTSSITLDGVEQARRGPVEGASEVIINSSRK